MKKENGKKALSILLAALMTLSMVMVLSPTTTAVTEVQIENAIVEGIKYLTERGGKQNPDGSWGSGVVRYAYTGLVLIKLQMRAYELGYASPFDPGYIYSKNVTAGWSFLFSTDASGNPLYALKQTLSLQDHTGGASGTVDDPDTNLNGYGIYITGYEVYSTGIVLMALQASGTPSRPNDGAIDYDGDLTPDTFQEIAQDMADWLAWAQSDFGPGEGGWAYSHLDNAGNAPGGGWTMEDNSNSGYALLGLAAAEAFGCTVPSWVRTELNVWITAIQDTSGGINDGGSWYRPPPLPPAGYGWPWVNELKAGNLIFEMTFYGDGPGVARFDAAMAYIVRHWQDMNDDPGWGYGSDKGIDDDSDGSVDEDPLNGIDDDGDGSVDEDPGISASYQAMFCLMKGFEYSGIDLIDLDGDNVPEHDWYAEFATVLVTQQRADGSWYHGGYGDARIDTAWALLTLEKVAPPPRRTLDKTVYKKVKMIPIPPQFWVEFPGGVTDIIVFDPPEIIEAVALVRDYAVLHKTEELPEGYIPLELLTWPGTEDLPWEPIDTPEDPCILMPGEEAVYDIVTDPDVTAVLVRYTVAWASTKNVIEAHFVNEAILESKSPQVIIGQLSNFDVHNDYHEPVDNLELELYGIQPSDIVAWFPGWGTPPQIHPIPPRAGMPAGTEIIWMDRDNPVMPCEWEHFGLKLKPGVIGVGVKAYWTQRPSAELGDVIHVKIDVTVPNGETVKLVDTLPPEVKYIPGTFMVNGVPATPTVTTTPPPPPISEVLSYTITTSGTHAIEFDVKVNDAYWEERIVCNVVVGTWYDETGEIVDEKEATACFSIHPFEELHKNVGIPKADVVFAIDLTGSMSTELGVIQAKAPTIISNIASMIADVQFGLITFMDYVGQYSTTSTVPGAVPTTYTATYGSAAAGDYPYKLDQDIGGAAAVIAAIGTLTSGSGVDWPQDYSRILHESWNSLTSPNPADRLHWRPGATRFLILLGDAQPHDTGFDYNCDGTPDNTGGDPGRDALIGTGDDLDFETEVAKAAAAGIRVLGVYSGGASMKKPWTYMASKTGGQFFWLTEAEQIPEAIKKILKAEAHETLTIKEKTETQWAFVIEVTNPFPYTMTNVMVKDNFGAELEVDEVVLMADPNGDAMVDIMDINMVFRALATDWTWPQGTTWGRWNPKIDFNLDGKVDAFDLHVAGQAYGSYVTMELVLDETGMSEKVHLFWYIGSLKPGKTARLILLVSTDLNPAGHQEYTEPGIYEMNSGATLKFIDPEQNMQLSAVTAPLYVTVLPLIDP